MRTESGRTYRWVGIGALLALAIGLSGCAGILGSGPGMPVVDNGGDNPDHAVTIDLTIQDTNGEPVADATVTLRDRGGTPDNREGTTGSQGRIRFIEGVGPPPCNSQTVVLPEYETSESLGCNEGGSTVERTITVQA